ncbi:BlaI/MecI/CopY family transcriptional regulator [Clostridiaceae bacterium M8S5]|nr:BlaI/MecI/CopY family transcriptional regulator [Clostridiaceae bacterium M8S5]
MTHQYKLYDAEFKFMKIIWENEPVNSTQLVKICEHELGWKKSTTYTVIKKLQKRNVLKNESAMVSSLITLEQVKKYEGEELVKRVFENSLSNLLVSFLDGKDISEEEINKLKQIIDSSRN